MAKEILKDEILSEKELDNVAGGSSEELGELVRAMHDNKNVGFDEGEYLFGSDERWKYLATLKLEKLGINADIQYSIFATKAFKDSYTDKATGKSLSHAEVLDIIKNYRG